MARSKVHQTVPSMGQINGEIIVERAKKVLAGEKSLKSPVLIEVVLHESLPATLVCSVCGFECPMLPTHAIDEQRRGTWPEHCDKPMEAI